MRLRESYEKALVLAWLFAVLTPAALAQDPKARFRAALRKAEVHLREATPAARATAADVAQAARREAHAAGVYAGPARARCLAILWQCQDAAVFRSLWDDPQYGDRAYLFEDRLQEDLVGRDADDRLRPLLLARVRKDHAAMIRLGRELGGEDDAYWLFVAEALEARGRYQQALAEVQKVFRKPDLAPETRAEAHDLEADCHLGLARKAAAHRDEHLEAADKALVRASDALLGVDSHAAVVARAEIRKNQGRRLEHKNLPEEAFLKYVESIEQLELGRATAPRLFGTSQLDLDPQRLAAVDGVLRTYEAAGYSITDALVLMDRLKSRDLLDWMAAPSKSQTIQGSIEMNNLLRAFPDTCFLCYWAGAERIYLLAMTVGPEGTRRLFDLGQRSKGLQLVADAHHQVSTPRSQPGAILDKASGFFLPKAVKPLLGTAQGVVVCPARGLGTLPWAALPVDGKALGVAWRLFTTPSLAILRQLSTRKAEGSGLVVVHSPFLDRDPASLGEQEARLVARHYHLLATMQGPVATLPNLRTVFEAHAGHVGVVHLAAHAVQHPGIPSLSFLVLRDRPLDMRSFATLKLEGCVVVLSHCRSQGSKGVHGLTWGPLGAGARTVVLSQWTGDPQATVELMDHFHHFRSQGHDEAEAMRHARQRVSNEGSYKHPYYWCGFEVIGSPFSRRSRGYGSYWWLLAAVGIVAGIYLWRRRS